MADRGMILHRIVLWNILILVCRASPQSNYADRGLDVEYQGNGIPQEAVLDGIVTKLDDLSSVIRTNRTTANLSCASRAMDVDLEFSEPFHGIVYADFNRHSSCSFVGKGELKHHYQLPLSGCGTVQDPLRVFTNNLIVRFHPALEMEGDEVKTIVCRYPEPIVPPVVDPPQLVISAETSPTVVPQTNPLTILLIICALLFLALMLFGVAFSYFCLKQRNIKLIRRRRALSSAPGSLVTGMSESTMQLPIFGGVKIPRAHPPSNPGSDQMLITGDIPPDHSDTLPSDYPSESRSSSEIEEGDTRSFRRPSTISSVCGQEVMTVDNTAFVHHEDDRLSSVYSDAHPQSEFDMIGAPTAVQRVEPAFDVAFRVAPLKRKSPSPPSSVTSDESRVAVMRAQERTLSTILEKEEWRQSELTSAKAQVLDNPELNPPTDGECPPPANYAQVKRKPRSVLSQRSIPDNDNWSLTEHEEVPEERRKPPEASFRIIPRQPSEREPSEAESTRTLVINEDIQVHTSTFHHVREDDETETMIVPTPERPVPPPKLQEVDDLYLKTVTEKRIIEENERIRRQVLEYHQRPRMPALPPNWDVSIRKHPPAQEPRTPSESTDWDANSQPPNWDVKIRQHPPAQEPREPSVSTDWDGMSQVPPPEWNVSIRQHPPVYTPREPSEVTDWDATSQAPPPPEWNVAIRQYPPVEEPREPSEFTDWDATSQAEPLRAAPPPDWKVNIRQHPPTYEPREPSESTDWDATSSVPPNWDIKIRQHPPVYEPRTPSELTDWDRMSQPPALPPDWDVKIRQHPPVYEPREPSEGTDWDATSQPPNAPPDWNVKIRQHPPVYEPREPSEGTDWDTTSQPPNNPPDWNVNIRQHPPVYEPREPSEGTDWDTTSQPPHHPPNWDVNIRQHPPVYEPRTPSESTDWDGASQTEPLRVDDLYTRMVTEKHIIEEEEISRLRYLEFHQRRLPPARPPHWDVTIRQHPPVYEPRPSSDTTDWDQVSASDVGSERPPVERPPVNWNVLIRVLNPPVPDDDTSSILTIEDREKWHRIITTESTLRTMLTEATVREDFERIRFDTRFERIFEPKKWDVIIRVLAPPPRAPRDDRSDTYSESTVNSEPPPRRFRKRSDAPDPRNRRPSTLAPVREGEQAPRLPSGPGKPRSTRSSVKSTDDVRSLPETTVEFAKFDPDNWSQSSGHTYQSSAYPRSTADRSHSEIVERQAMYPGGADWPDDESERMSRPSLARSTSEFTENNWSTPQRVPFDRMSTGSGYSSSSNRKPLRRAESAEEEAAEPAADDDNSMDSSPGQYRRNRRVPYQRVSSSSGESETGSRPQ